VARSIFFYSDSGELGGAELALLMLADGLGPEWAPTLLVDDLPGAVPLIERAAASGLPVRRVEPMPLGLGGARTAVGFAQMLRRERPAVFHAHLSWPLAAKWGLAAAVAARLPTVATVQLIPEFELTRSEFWQLRALAQGVDRHVAVSHALAAELAERFRWPATKIEVIYNAVQIERFDLPPHPGVRGQLQAGQDRPLVLTCARLDEQKGHETLLKASAMLPEAIFVLAGSGPLQEPLERLAAELGVADRVRFLGHRRDVPELLAAADVFALPSLYEGSPLAVLEAMAARRAVVSSAIGGTDELIGDGESGLLVPPGDPQALAGALGRVLADRELRDTLANGARERVERDFSQQATSAGVERIYRQLAAG
jgi:glycosyltransferase involved in cell wall biosynthesis